MTRIDVVNNPLNVHLQRSPTAKDAHPTARQRSLNAAGLSKSYSKGLRGSSELNNLIQTVSRIPEVRAELVQDVQQRLANGEYDTREAVLGTASAILNGLDS